MGGPKPTASRALVEYVQGELGCQRRRMRWDDPGICRSHGGWTSEPPAWTERGCCVAVRVADGMMAIVVSELRGMRSPEARQIELLAEKIVAIANAAGAGVRQPLTGPEVLQLADETVEAVRARRSGL